MIILENYEEFGIVLSNRFHTILSHLENISGNFTAFIQAINRSDFNKLNQKTLSYIGLQEQKRRLLKSQNQITFDSNNEEDRTWIFLSETDFREKTIESYTFYNNFKKGKLRIQDVKLQSLKEYFKKITNEPQQAEYIILSKYFEIERASFVTLPLIQFGDFDGLVYVVFDNRDIALYESKEVKIRIIKNFSIEYEKLLLEWKKSSFKGPNSDLSSHLSFLQSDEYYELINTNPILVSLNFKQYYLDSNLYYRLSINRLNKDLNKKSENDLIKKDEHSTNWEMPEALSTAFHQFLIYFSEYAKNIHNLNIDIKVEKIAEGLKLTALNTYPDEIVLVDNLLSQYLELFLTQSYSELEQKILGDKIKRFEYNQNLRELKMENEILKFKIQNLLEKMELVDSIIGKLKEEFQVKINYFKIPQVNSIIFSKNLQELDIYHEVNINEKEIEIRLFKDVRLNLEKGEISYALTMLSNYFESKKNVDKQNEVSILRSAFESLKKEKKLGIVKDDVFFLQQNKILNAVLIIISSN